MTYLPPANGGRINATIGGNTAGAGALVSSGTLTLAGGNNITLSQNANAITISGAAAGAAGSNTLGMSNLGNTSGTTGVVSASAFQFAFAGGNNVTLSQSLNASSGTLTISAANQTAQTQSNIQALYDGANSISTGTVRLSNANGISFGINAQTLTASHNALTSQTNQTVGLYALGNTTQNSSTTLDARTLSLNGLGAATVGYSNGSIQISAPTQTAQTQSNIQAIYDGANSISTGTIRFSNANGVSFGINGQTLTASAAGGGIALANSQTTYTSGTANLVVVGGAMTIASTTGQSFNFSVPQTSSLSATGAVSIASNGSTVSIGAPAASTYNSTVFGLQNAWGQTSTSLAQNTMYIFPEILDEYVSGSVIKIPVMLTNSSSATGAHTRGYTASFGIYSRNATNSTVLTRMYSTSYTAGMSANSNGTWAISIITGVGNSTSYSTLSASSAGLNLSASVHGARELIMPLATNLGPGEYWFALHNSSSSAGAAGNLFNVSFLAVSSTNLNQMGVSTASSNNGLGRNLGYGVYSTSTNGMPAGISMTQINQSVTNVNPVIYFLSATA